MNSIEHAKRFLKQKFYKTSTSKCILQRVNFLSLMNFISNFQSVFILNLCATFEDNAWYVFYTGWLFIL